MDSVVSVRVYADKPHTDHAPLRGRDYKLVWKSLKSGREWIDGIPLGYSDNTLILL